MSWFWRRGPRSRRVTSAGGFPHGSAGRRLTVSVLRGLACSFVPLIVAIFSHQTLPWLVLSPAAFVLATVPWLVAVASRNVAFAPT